MIAKGSLHLFMLHRFLRIVITLYCSQVIKFERYFPNYSIMKNQILGLSSWFVVMAAEL